MNSKEIAVIYIYNGKCIQIRAASPAITEVRARSLNQHRLSSFWSLISQSLSN